VEAIRSTIANNLGDTPGALAHAHRALDLLTPDDEQSRIEIAQVLLNLADANTAGDDPAAVQVMYAKAIALNRAAGNLATAITAMSGLGRVQTHQGHLHEAAYTLREALALATEGGRSLPWPSTGKAHIFLGALLYEWNDLEEVFMRLISEPQGANV
jgi:tetratricopeptide (TPR) repeat protein